MRKWWWYYCLCNRFPGNATPKINKINILSSSRLSFTLFRWPKREERSADQRRSEYYHRVLLRLLLLLLRPKRERKRENSGSDEIFGRVCSFLWWWDVMSKKPAVTKPGCLFFDQKTIQKTIHHLSRGIKIKSFQLDPSFKQSTSRQKSLFALFSFLMHLM